MEMTDVHAEQLKRIVFIARDNKRDFGEFLFPGGFRIIDPVKQGDGTRFFDLEGREFSVDCIAAKKLLLALACADFFIHGCKMTNRERWCSWTEEISEARGELTEAQAEEAVTGVIRPEEVKYIAG